jgi:hypothetical protein
MARSNSDGAVTGNPIPENKPGASKFRAVSVDYNPDVTLVRNYLVEQTGIWNLRLIERPTDEVVKRENHKANEALKAFSRLFSNE